MRFRLNTLLLFGSLAWLTLSLPTDKVMAGAQDYQALSLEDCLAMARQQNPVLAASREKVQELVADYQAARSKFFPRLVLTSYYDRQPPNRFPPGGNLTGRIYSSGKAIPAFTASR